MNVKTRGPKCDNVCGYESDGTKCGERCKGESCWRHKMKFSVYVECKGVCGKTTRAGGGVCSYCVKKGWGFRRE